MRSKKGAWTVGLIPAAAKRSEPIRSIRASSRASSSGPLMAISGARPRSSTVSSMGTICAQGRWAPSRSHGHAWISSGNFFQLADSRTFTKDNQDRIGFNDLVGWRVENHLAVSLLDADDNDPHALPNARIDQRFAGQFRVGGNDDFLDLQFEMLARRGDFNKIDHRWPQDCLGHARGADRVGRNDLAGAGAHELSFLSLLHRPGPG